MSDKGDQIVEAVGRLRSRAAAAGIDVRVGGEQKRVIFSVPNGRNSRSMVLNKKRLDDLLSIDFESFSFLGDVDAIWNSQTGEIEASVTLDGTRGFFARRPLMLNGLPGVEELDPAPEAPSEQEDLSYPRPEKNWRLRLRQDGREIEFSAPSTAGETYLGETVTLKLRGFEPQSHDEALDALERISAAVFFEMDALYAISLAIPELPSRSQRDADRAATKPLEFPRRVYSTDALALYRYGRSSAEFPLLEFLAYYQSVEYFFPLFAQEQTTKAIRAALLDVTFNPNEDRDILRLASLAAPGERAGLSERDQLKAVLRACFDPSGLDNVVDQIDPEGSHFFPNRQKIKGVPQLRRKDKQYDFRDQVAERIYRLRCRVVHTKLDGEPETLLLPSSAEAKALGPDIKLLRYIAQRVLFARAKFGEVR